MWSVRASHLVHRYPKTGIVPSFVHRVGENYTPVITSSGSDQRHWVASPKPVAMNTNPAMSGFAPYLFKNPKIPVCVVPER